jgi:aspartate oxidase
MVRKGWKPFSPNGRLNFNKTRGVVWKYIPKFWLLEQTADSGAQVVASKREILKGGAACFLVAEAAAYNAADPALAGDVEKHYNDIMLAAQGMASAELAAILAVSALSAVRTLENRGLAFDMTEELASYI